MVVRWPVLVEVDLLLRARGHARAAIMFCESLMAGVHRMESPRGPELELTLHVAYQYRQVPHSLAGHVADKGRIQTAR